jgi:RNA recognition motif-containing protein
LKPQQITNSSTSKHTANMSNTVNVKGISHETTEKEVRDFFSFW